MWQETAGSQLLVKELLLGTAHTGLAPGPWPLAPGPQLLLLWQRDRFLQVGLFIIHALPLCKACWEQRWQQLLATSTRAGHKGAQRGPLYLSGSVQSCWAEGQGLCLLRENE